MYDSDRSIQVVSLCLIGGWNFFNGVVYWDPLAFQTGRIIFSDWLLYSLLNDPPNRQCNYNSSTWNVTLLLCNLRHIPECCTHRGDKKADMNQIWNVDEVHASTGKECLHLNCTTHSLKYLLNGENCPFPQSKGVQETKSVYSHSKIRVDINCRIKEHKSTPASKGMNKINLHYIFTHGIFLFAVSHNYQQDNQPLQR